jgi:hypothetical protein
VVKGKITAEDMVMSLQRGAKQADIDFAKTSTTIDQRMTGIKNSWLAFVGAIEEASGEGNPIGEALASIAESFDFLAEAIKSPKEAVEDFQRTMEFFLRDTGLDKFLNIMSFLIKGTGIPDIADFAAGQFVGAGGKSASRFAGPLNPVSQQKDVIEKNSAATLEELKGMNKNLSNIKLHGTFAP